MVTILLRRYGKNTATAVSALNIAVSADQEGVQIEPIDLDKCEESLKKDGYTYKVQGRVIVVDCKSITCF